MTYLFPFCIAVICALGLASCNIVDGGSGGTDVKEPTVDQMTEMEKQWGIKPHENRTRPQTSPGEYYAPSAPMQSTAAQFVTPDPVPLPPTPSAVPPVFEPPQSATPAQIQKLRN